MSQGKQERERTWASGISALLCTSWSGKTRLSAPKRTSCWFSYPKKAQDKSFSWHSFLGERLRLTHLESGASTAHSAVTGVWHRWRQGHGYTKAPVQAHFTGGEADREGGLSALWGNHHKTGRCSNYYGDENGTFRKS